MMVPAALREELLERLNLRRSKTLGYGLLCLLALGLGGFAGQRGKGLIASRLWVSFPQPPLREPAHGAQTPWPTITATPAQAIPLLQSFLQNYPHSWRKGDAALLLARDYCQLGQKEEAQSWCRQARQWFSGQLPTPWISITCAAMWLEAGDPEESWRELSQIPLETGASARPVALKMLGLVAQVRGHQEQAYCYWTQLAREFPHTPEAQHLSGPLAALEHDLRLPQTSSRRATAARWLAENGRLADALTLLETAAPDSLLLYTRLTLLEKANRFEQSLALAEEFLSRYAGDAWEAQVRLTQARILARRRSKPR